MRKTACLLRPLLAFVALLILATPLQAQPGRPDPAKLLAAQREAMAKLAFMDGNWRGAAKIINPGGTHEMVQTERVGTLLDGAVRLIEGRGYEADGTLSFNAFAVVSWDVARSAYSMRSHAQGNAGDFTLNLTADGFTWEIPAGPMVIRYQAVIKDGVWTETGDRVMPGKEPVRFVEMRLERVGDSEWPAGGAVAP